MSEIKPAKFFQEDNGNLSSIRLMSMLSLFMSAILSLIIVITDNNSDNALLITFGFLLGAFVPKTVQKFAEENIKR